MTTRGCIIGDDLNLFLSGQAEAVKREEMESHLSNCRACRQRLVGQYQDSQAETVSTSAPGWLKARVLRIPQEGPVAAPTFTYVGRRQVAAAAVIIVALSIGIIFMRDSFRTSQVPKDDVVRQDARISAAPRLLSPSGGEQLSSNEIEFRWSEVQGADGNVFTLLNDKGDIVSKTSTKETHLKLKTSDVRLEPGKTYFWYVGAKLPAGTIVDSEISKFVFNHK